MLGTLLIIIILGTLLPRMPLELLPSEFHFDKLVWKGDQLTWGRPPSCPISSTKGQNQLFHTNFSLDKAPKIKISWASKWNYLLNLSHSIMFWKKMHFPSSPKCGKRGKKPKDNPHPHPPPPPPEHHSVMTSFDLDQSDPQKREISKKENPNLHI